MLTDMPFEKYPICFVVFVVWFKRRCLTFARHLRVLLVLSVVIGFNPLSAVIDVKLFADHK